MHIYVTESPKQSFVEEGFLLVLYDNSLWIQDCRLPGA